MTETNEITEQRRIVGRIIKVHKTGWGFISSKEIQFTRIFFHWTALKKDSVPFLELETGMIAEFTPVQVPEKGWRAVHIKVSPRAPREEGEEDGFRPGPIETPTSSERGYVPTLSERQPDTD